MSLSARPDAAVDHRSDFERLHALVMTSRAGTWAIAGVFFAVTATLGLRLCFLHDEGVFTYDFARALLRAPAAGFFFVKAKPVLMLFSALPALGGYPCYLVVHAALGALALVLVSEAARAVGATRPNVAALLLGTSASFVVASANGYPNADGCLVLAAALYAYFSDKRALAAVLLGALPFARNELAPVTFLFSAHDFWRRRDARFVATTLVFPVLYGLAGGFYHHDFGWLFHKFPNPQGMPTQLKVYAPPTPSEALRSLQAGLLAGSPLFASLALFAASRGRHATWPLWGSAIAIYGVMTVCQVVGVLGFDTSPRYHVAPLALLAVLAALALSPAAGDEPGAPTVPRPAPFVLAPALLTACALQGSVGAVAAGAGLLAAVLCLVKQRYRSAELLLVAGAVIVAGLALADPNLRETAQHARAHRLVEGMRRAGIYRGQALYTDLYAVRFDRDLGVAEAHVLVNDAISWELLFDANPANGQTAALEAALAAEGLSFRPEAHRVRRDAVYAIRRLERTARWRALLEAAAPRRVNDDDFEIYWWDAESLGAGSSGAP